MLNARLVVSLVYLFSVLCCNVVCGTTEQQMEETGSFPWSGMMGLVSYSVLYGRRLYEWGYRLYEYSGKKTDAYRDVCADDWGITEDGYSSQAVPPKIYCMDQAQEDGQWTDINDNKSTNEEDNAIYDEDDSVSKPIPIGIGSPPYKSDGVSYNGVNEKMNSYKFGAVFCDIYYGYSLSDIGGVNVRKYVPGGFLFGGAEAMARFYMNSIMVGIRVAGKYSVHVESNMLPVCGLKDVYCIFVDNAVDFNELSANKEWPLKNGVYLEHADNIVLGGSYQNRSLEIFGGKRTIIKGVHVSFFMLAGVLKMQILHMWVDAGRFVTQEAYRIDIAPIFIGVGCSALLHTYGGINLEPSCVVQLDVIPNMINFWVGGTGLLTPGEPYISKVGGWVFGILSRDNDKTNIRVLDKTFLSGTRVVNFKYSARINSAWSIYRKIKCGYSIGGIIRFEGSFWFPSRFYKAPQVYLDLVNNSAMAWYNVDVVEFIWQIFVSGGFYVMVDI